MRLPNWNLTFTAKRRLQRAGLITAIVVMVLILVWFCWVIWAERYVVYSREGATINTKLPERMSGGQVAAPPSTDETVPCYINEGSDAIKTDLSLEKITGYYVEQEDLIDNLQGVKDVVATLPANTAVLLELKNVYGRFNYTSGLTFAEMAGNINTAGVDQLITDLNSRNLYSIALIPAFRERNYVIQRNDFFLKNSSGFGWADELNCYWLDPTDTGTLNWLIQITEELRTLGFDEVVFTEFRFPNTDRIVFKGDKNEALQSAAKKLVESCATNTFTVSFCTNDTAFKLPEGGMSRLYLENVGAKDVEPAAAKVSLENPEAELVFLATSTDTRYSKYSSLRSITVAATH